LLQQQFQVRTICLCEEANTFVRKWRCGAGVCDT
jgi:hypothetical protein